MHYFHYLKQLFQETDHKASFSLSLLVLGLLGTFTSIYLLQKPAIIQQHADQTVSSGYPVRVGMTYTHTSFAGCTTPTGGTEAGFSNTGIIYSYDKPGVRDTVKQELTNMKNSGIQSLGLVIWHMHDFTDAATWGVVSSANKRLDEPYRTNFINYLTDVKNAGFDRILITMGPQWRNSPSGHDGPGKWDSSMFEENWQFLRDVHALVKQYGPANAYFDILGEGAPPDPDPVRKQQMWNYDKQLWTNYVKEFGKDDAVISFIAPNPIHPNDPDLWNSGALDNLYTIFQSSGVGQPNWYQFSFYPSNGTYARSLQELNYIDEKLTAKGYTGNLIIREGWYNNAQLAKAIADFNTTHSRKVTDVTSWFIPYYDNSGDPQIDKLHCPVSPPYSQSEYISNLPQTTGTIAASPNPCTIAAGQTACTETITWSTTNLTSIPAIIVRETGGLFAQSPQGSGEVPWVAKTPTHLDLYDGIHLLNTVTIWGQ